jgi:hypothetical protein
MFVIGITFLLTVTWQVADLPPAVAVIVDVPSATAVTVPPWTVATELFELDQVTVLSVAFAGLTVAVREPVAPTFRAMVCWFKVTPDTGTFAGVGSIGSSFGPQATKRAMIAVRAIRIRFLIFYGF